MNLNFGSGDVERHDGWVNMDMVHGLNVDVVHDILDGPMPFGPGAFEIVFVSHVLSLFDCFQLPAIATELCRVTKSGGKVRIIDIHLGKAMHAATTGDYEFFEMIPDGYATSLGGKLSAHLTGCGTRKTLFTPDYLHELFWQWGHGKQVTWGGCPLDNRKAESFVWELTRS